MQRAALVALLLVCAARPGAGQSTLGPPTTDLAPVPSAPRLGRQAPPPAPREPRPPAEPPQPAEPRATGVFGQRWQDAEFLLWWPSDGRVPVLATSGTRPAVGPNLDARDQAGGRFTLGFSLDPAQTVGLEGTYFFLGTRTTTFSAAGSGEPGSPTVGVPYFDAVRGAETTFSLAAPGSAQGVIDVSSSARLQGAELNGLVNLFATAHYQFDALLGFRYFQLHEGIQIAGRSAPPGVPLSEGTAFADQFDGHNRFYGGQVGVRGEVRKGLLFLGVTAKLALGDVQQVVRIGGVRREPGTGQQSGGLFAAGSNGGRHARDVLGLLPEATVRLGFMTGPRTRLFVGYNVIYLSDAARPGDQIDRGLDPPQLPVLSGQTVPTAERPRFNFNSTDYWVQGLVVGLEYRY